MFKNFSFLKFVRKNLFIFLFLGLLLGVSSLGVSSPSFVSADIYDDCGAGCGSIFCSAPCNEFSTTCGCERLLCDTYDLCGFWTCFDAGCSGGTDIYAGCWDDYVCRNCWVCGGTEICTGTCPGWINPCYNDCGPTGTPTPPPPTPPTPPPGVCDAIIAPTSPSVSALTSVSATLNWVEGSGGSSKLLRVGPNQAEVENGCPGGVGSPPLCVIRRTLSAGQNSFDTGSVLVPNTTYYWRVVEVDDSTGGWLDFGNTCQVASSENFTTLLPLPPGDPSPLTATAACLPEEVDLSWIFVANATEYRVERCTGAGCVFYTEIATVVGITYTDPTVLNSTTYQYRVRGYNSATAQFGVYSNIELVNVACPECTIDITEVSFTLSAGSTDLVLTGYTEDNGLINNVNFSIDPTIASVCQDGTGPCLPPTGVWIDSTRTLFWADLTGAAIGGPTTLTAVATMDDLVTICSDTAEVTVTNAGEWWQVKEGDVVTATGSIRSNIPATCLPPSCDPVFITIDLGDFPGVPTCDGSGCSSFGSGSVSADPPGGWIAEDSEYSSTQVYDYAFFEARIPSGVSPNNPGPTLDISAVTGGFLGPNNYYWFQTTTDLVITNTSGVSSVGDNKVIVFVDGDLTIKIGMKFFGSFINSV